ncbi:MAG: glycosyltransferase family 4 protein [Candidatus Poseidoniales archaeon]|nr:glycosyltransferase family 4 protein [Candidatus Poseidoniales archaeon]
MHILVMTRSTLAHGFGGFQRQCMDLCEGFIAKGHRITIVTTSHPDNIEMEEKDGYVVHYLNPSKPRKLSRNWFKESKKLVKKIHLETPIDIIHSNEFADTGIMSWANNSNIPIVVVCHGSLRTELLSFLSSADKRPRYWHWMILTPLHLLRRCLVWEMPMRRNAAKIILVSPTLERDFSVFSKNKVSIIENGIKLPERTDFVDNKGQLRLLCTGRADRQKGFQKAIMAVNEIDDLDLHLDIVGTGAYLSELKVLVSKLGVSKKITFHGRVDDDELARIYADADIYLIPTMRYEGLPLALLEAMSHGIPTISSCIGGNADVITHDFDGLFIKPGNLKELIDSIKKLGNNSKLRNSISVAARETTEKRFDKERMVKETLEILENISLNKED